ncbi:MAG TPA: TonB-dependent receptor [Gemmatimonadales bacterium]|nr:TonB-dependent receptor [Gemmatimonadales bacterium]
MRVKPDVGCTPQAAVRWLRCIVSLVTLHLLSVTTVHAQIPDDTLAPDSLAEDTVDYTARFLEAQERVALRVPVLAQLERPGPRPALTRTVFTRDSIEWGHATTVGDLLAQVPGVFLWRGGFVGRPEPVNFQARGAGSTEYYLDGLPYVPAGVDSVAVDPALLSISFLERMEVERWPGLLRIYLFTRRHDRLAPRSRIAIARGEGDFARYEGSLERRFSNGLGFGIAADYLNSPTASGRSSSYSNTQFWLQGSYIPSSKIGVQYQLLRSAPNRRPFVVADPISDDTIGLGFDARRTDAQLRLSWRADEGGLGPRLDLLYGRTSWDGGSVEQRISQFGGALAYRTPTFSAGASAYHRTRWTALDVRGTFGWTPTPAVTARAEAVHQRHYGGRNSSFVALAAGLQPVRGFALTGSARIGNVVTAPAITADTAQDISDYEAALGWERQRLGLRLAFSRTAAFSPFGYAEFPGVASLGTVPDAEWVTARVRLAPLRWLTLEGWYSDPRDIIPEGVPPTHSMTAVTLRSKFLRQFPSGVFDLKLRLSVESWGTGVIGRDAAGLPITLGGATFFRTLLQIQLQSFSLFWDRGNLTASELTYVPGFELPAYGTVFGVRWEFLN